MAHSSLRGNTGAILQHEAKSVQNIPTLPVRGQLLLRLQLQQQMHMYLRTFELLLKDVRNRLKLYV